MAQRTRHPIVAAYLGSKPFLSAIAGLPPPATPLEVALHGVFAYQRGQLDLEEVLSRCRRARLDDADPELLILFANNYAAVADEAGNAAEAAPVVGRARSLVSEEAPVELQCSVLNAESLLARATGNVARQQALLREVVARYGTESPRRVGALMNQAFYLALVGRASELEAELDELTRTLPARGKARLDFFRAIDALEAGRLAEAAERFAAASRHPESLVGYEPEVRTYELLRTVASHVAGGPRPAFDPQAPAWARATLELAARRPERALALARRDAARDPQAVGIAVGFPAFTLIRAELASGNGEAARRLLGLRRRRGNVHSLDAFFLARVELLGGRADLAASHLRTALTSAARSGGEGRLDLELQLACELALGEVLRLGRAVERSEPALPPAQPPPEVVEPRLGVRRLLGASDHLAAVRERVVRYAPHEASVLVTGETGTGKDLVARALHEEGPRRGAPFVAINCAAIPESLLESELFGYARGAFTGALRSHPGVFAQAAEGTLLLDEVGDVPPRVQAALLRVLEDGDYRPVGAEQGRRARCRIVAATNADLDALVAAGRFRADLLYRLRRLQVVLLPLRDRPEDIAPIARELLAAGRRDHRRPDLTAGLERALLAHPWPGNVRELQNVVERMRIIASEAATYDEATFRAALEPAADGSLPAAPEPTRPPPSEQAPRGSAPTAEEDVLRQGRSPLRRRERLEGLFRRHRRLTRQEVAQVLGVSLGTATRDLKALTAKGVVCKVTPTASPRTHYFELGG